MQGIPGAVDAAIHIEHCGEHTLYILFINKVIASVVLTQTKNASTYIRYADSTGLKRGYTGRFLAGILSSIRGLVVCFSRPHPEPILGRSSANGAKRMRAPHDLFRYWMGVFQKRCGCALFLGKESMLQEGRCGVRAWSNFGYDRSHPYRSAEEIESFEDDPVSKMARNMACRPSINELFAGLLVRSDFASGGLLFSQCFCSGTAIDGEDRAEHIRERLQGSTDDRASASVPAPPSAGPRRISKIIKMLRRGDFSSEMSAAEETANLLSKFSISLRYFPVLPVPKEDATPKEETVVRLVPRAKTGGA